jgi:hypothetical protein
MIWPITCPTSLTFPATPSSHATLVPSSPGRLPDDLEVVLRPTIGFQVRLPRFVVIWVLRVAARAATVLPRRQDFSGPPFNQQPVDLPLPHFTALLGTDIPVKPERVPVPTIATRTRLARQPLPRLLHLRWRGCNGLIQSWSKRLTHISEALTLSPCPPAGQADTVPSSVLLRLTAGLISTAAG